MKPNTTHRAITETLPTIDRRGMGETMIKRPDESSRTSSAGRRAVRLALIFAAVLALVVGPAAATTVTFQQGANGYTSARDTHLQQNPSDAGSINGAATNLNWDADDPNGTGYDVYALVRFDNIFGGGAGQVPLGAQITAATLSYVVYNTGGTGTLHEVLIAWDPATASYNSFCGGGCSEGLQYGAQVGTAPASSAALQSTDVTATVQRWSDGAVNRGWFLQTTGTDGVDVRSSDYSTVSERPILTIRYNEGPPTSNLVRQPYLQLVTPNSITVVWRTDTATDSRVEYGTVFGTYDQSATIGTVGTDHYVPITSLSPSTKYYYRVGSTTAVQGGGTADFYFTTSPLAGTSPRAFRFWIFGDSGICSEIQNTVRNSMLTYTAANPPAPDLFLHTGDVAQVSGADAEYTDCHLAYYTTVLRHTPFFPGMGNHDSYSTTCQDPGLCTGPYFSTFVLPTNAEAGGVASNTEAYYSWDYGNAHFIVLNGSNVSRSPTGPMATWLQADLAATTQQWVIAYWHQAPYTKGTHDSDSEGDLIEFRANILPILEAGGVDLVLNGHSHGYERSYLIDGTYTNPTPTYSTLVSQGHILDAGSGQPPNEYLKSPGVNSHEGTVYAVVASGGQPPGGAHGHPVMYYSESINGSALVDVGANELTLTMLRSDGTVRDTFTIRKGDLPPRVASVDPPKSSVITALPYVEVTFNMDVQGVDAADMTVNGSSATTVQVISPSVYRFNGYTAPGQGTVSVILAAGGIESVDNTDLDFAGDSWTYSLDLTPPRIADETPARGSVIGALASVTVSFSKPVTGVVAGGLTVNGSAATSVSGSAAGPYIFTGYATPPNGLVTVVLAAGSIQDAQGRPFAGDTWNYALTRRLVINEFLASNNTAAHDEYGEFDDYLEIYNPTDATVDMSGMYLSDSLTSKSQYRIPSGVTVPPHGHIVFWCDSTPSQGALHTNFNILRAGEELGLFDTDENGLAAIDTLTFSTQTTDVASGRFPDGVDGFVSMPTTPGAPNTISCSSAGQCTALTDACNIGACSGNRCVSQATNEGGSCDDGVDCTGPDTCTAGVCNGGADTCPLGQVCNHGTGICEAEQLDPLPIDVGEAWRYFKGTAEPTPGDLTAWTRTDFDDGTWLEGPSGFGYGVDCTAQRGTTLSDMLNGYVSLYLRKGFQVNDPARVNTLTLTVDYDDAFVAYINGTEVARSRVPVDPNILGTPPPYGQLAVQDHECSSCNSPPCLGPEIIDISAFKSALVAGVNVLAIQVHNLTLGSSDLTMVPTLASTEVQGCIYDSECNDNEPCTDDLCNLGTGVCTNPPDNTNPCTDGVACTTDSCSAGACVSTDNCFGGLTCNYTTGVCESAPVTVTFQQDIGGYVGTQDTYLFESGPDTIEGAAIVWRWDTQDPATTGLYEYGLIRFDNIFGAGAGQIPAGSTITSATLTIYIENGTVAPAGSVNEAAVDWSEAATTWNNFGGEAGVQADEYGALVASAPLGTGYPVSANIDVTSSLQAWSGGSSTNYGWIFRPVVTDGVAVTSSEGATVANRPKLSVTYTSPGLPCTDDTECDDGQFCNGAERCVDQACQAGTPPTCDDTVACTADSCNESTDSCDHTPNDSLCNDANVCTDDTCNAGSGCIYAPNTAACSDNNACTTGDYCSAGSCQPGVTPVTCNDSIACTTDSCLPASGCQYVDNCGVGQTCNHTTGICESGPQTLTFQQGINSYSQALDTFIGDGTVDMDASINMVIDGSPVNQALLRFDGIFGPGANQIPQGSTVVSATLTLRIGGAANDQSVSPVNFHSLLQTWLVTDEWAAYGVAPWNATAGIQADDVEAVSTADATATMNTLNTSYPVDVTARVQVWANNPSGNFGWVILPSTGQTDGLRVQSSDSATPTYRPLLSVTFTPPVSQCTSDPQCDDGLYCTGVETCDLGTSTCLAGTPVDCSDGVACTDDSCNEATDSCDNTPDDGACNDSNVCTDDACNLTLGCQYTNNTASCSDGNACTTSDVCAAGACVGGGPTNCDDGVACTTDTCDSGLGCLNADSCTGGLVCNHTTGVCETVSYLPLPIVYGDTWKYFKGLSEPTPVDLTAWRQIGFDDSAWLEGPSGLGYDYYVETGGTNGNGDYGPFIGTELGDMRGCTPLNPPLCNSPGYVSVYMRKAFTVANPAAVATLTFRMYADDGYVAYLNGTEVQRIRMGTATPPLYNALATGGPSVAPPVEQTIDLTSFTGLLVTGVNVLAVQLHNATLDSRDLLVIPQLSSTESQGCDDDPDCSDNDVCNGIETCVAGQCQPGTPLDCGDGLACTTDSCDPITGCGHAPAPIGTSCGDGDACNGAETCDGAGICQDAPDLNCNDGVACTTDSCDTVAGCLNVDNCTGGRICNLLSGVCEAMPVTVTFQQGDANSYSGTVDTYIYALNPATSYESDATLNADGTPPTTDERQILIRFDNIFGSGPNQIPVGAVITSATLTVNVTNAFAATEYVRFHRMKQTWSAGATWSTFGDPPWNTTDGVQRDDVEAVAAADVTVNDLALGVRTITVTPSLQAWAADPASYFGWVITSGTADTLAFDSANHTTVANRPKLSVTYEAGGPQGRFTCSLSSPTASPGGSTTLTGFLENLGSLEGVRGYQTQLQVTRTSGAGTVATNCPGGVSIDESRTDYIFYNHTDDYPVTNCSLQRASSSLYSGSVTVGGSPVYVASYDLLVSADAAPGSTFEITFAPHPDSALANAANDPIDFELGPACVLTIGSCTGNEQCDDDNACTDDVCNAGVCQNTPDETNTCDDGDVCTTVDSCSVEGICVGGQPLQCNDGSQCTADSCNPSSGCVFTITPGAACEDGDSCTTGDACDTGGVCVGGTPTTCDDDNSCTADSCVSGTGCVFTPTPGVACDDGDACTTGDSCDAGGVCQPGAPMNCDDGDLCTTDACSAGQCVHGPSGACGVTGMFRYYRDGATVTEPSVKPKPGAGVDVDEDSTAEATTGAGGVYTAGDLFGNVTVRALRNYGALTQSDRSAVSSLDSVQISRFSIGLTSLSLNQRLAGDVSGNGLVTSYDAARVSQFAVELIQHFEVADSTLSDWKFLRCDHYNSASDQDCTGNAVYAHAPLAGTPTDDFYAVLYGDVTGNWQAGGGFVATSAMETNASPDEARAAAEAQQLALNLRPMVAQAVRRAPNAGPAILTVGRLTRPLAPGAMAEVDVLLVNADGIEGLDLRLTYDSTQFEIVGVQKGDLASGFNLGHNDVGGEVKVSLFGVMPLQGSGKLLKLAVRARTDTAAIAPFRADVQANEGRIPVRIANPVERQPRPQNSGRPGSAQ